MLLTNTNQAHLNHNTNRTMTHLEFTPYHNFHITFRLKTGVEFSGVVTNTLKEDEKSSHTTYAFVPTSNMMARKEAEKSATKRK
jgi:hypothetical protein